jgi:beta-phosphoglucomutase
MLHSFESYRLGLVTSSEKSEVLPVLRAAGIDQCFDAMVFGDEVEHRKPAPDPYLLLSKRMGSWTGIVFEDSDAGILSARQAGYTAIRVPDAEQLSQIVYRELSRR